jgi:hypothetical protein
MFGGGDCLGPLHQMKECENMPDCPGRKAATSFVMKTRTGRYCYMLLCDINVFSSLF